MKRSSSARVYIQFGGGSGGVIGGLDRRYIYFYFKKLKTINNNLKLDSIIIPLKCAAVKRRARIK